MGYGPHLFNLTEPTLIVVTINSIKSGPLDDMRQVDLRVKPFGGYSLYAHALVGRYASEADVMRQAAALLQDWQEFESVPRQHQVQTEWAAAMERVQPF